MTVLTESPDTRSDRPVDTDHRCRRLQAALVLVTIVALALGAAVVFRRARQDDSLGAPTEVQPALHEVLDQFTLAMETNDPALLRTLVTPRFRRTFYQGDADGSPWRDVWRLERYEFWNHPKAAPVVWEIERLRPPLVQGSGPWYVAEAQIWRSASKGIQYAGVAAFVLVVVDGTLFIDDTYWAAQPAPLRPRSHEPVTSAGTRADFEQWLVGRFVSAGLDPPDVEVTWLTPSPECPEGGSFAQRAGAVSGRRHVVTLCLDRPDLVIGADVDGRWSSTATRYGLHEYAHAWMYDHVDDATRTAFLERTGLVTWRGESAWGELGVEHAAETIGWGVAGVDAARYDIVPEPSCAELTTRFELLTGVPPSTSCTT